MADLNKYDKSSDEDEETVLRLDALFERLAPGLEKTACVTRVLFSDMAMQMCNRRVTQVTTNFVRQLAKPIPMKVEDDHHDDEHTHIAVPSTPVPTTYVSMNKHLLRGNAAIITGLSSMCQSIVEHLLMRTLCSL